MQVGKFVILKNGSLMAIFAYEWIVVVRAAHQVILNSGLLGRHEILRTVLNGLVCSLGPMEKLALVVFPITQSTSGKLQHCNLNILQQCVFGRGLLIFIASYLTMAESIVPLLKIGMTCKLEQFSTVWVRKGNAVE